MNFIRTTSRAGTALSMFLAWAPSWAGEGRTPLFAPTVIAADGRYVVTRSIVGSGAAPVIEIAASNVDLDLNGFTVTQPGSTFAVILVSAASDVTIHDGTLTGGLASINAPGGGRKLVVEDVKSQESTGAALGAIHVFDVGNVVIRRCVVVDVPAQPCIRLEATSGVVHGIIEGNVIRGCGGAGILAIGARGLSISNNSLDYAGGGISVSGTGNVIAQNTIADVAGAGIELRGSGRANKIWNNTVASAGSHGIFLLAGVHSNLVLDNVVSGCGFSSLFDDGSGLRVESANNKIEGNLLSANAACGLHFFGPSAAFNTFGRNVARGNVGADCPAPTCPPLFWPESCDAGGAGNDSYGDNLIPGPPVF